MVVISTYEDIIFLEDGGKYYEEDLETGVLTELEKVCALTDYDKISLEGIEDVPAILGLDYDIGAELDDGSAYIYFRYVR